MELAERTDVLLVACSRMQGTGRGCRNRPGMLPDVYGDLDRGPASEGHLHSCSPARSALLLMPRDSLFWAMVANLIVRREAETGGVEDMMILRPPVSEYKTPLFPSSSPIISFTLLHPVYLQTADICPARSINRPPLHDYSLRGGISPTYIVNDKALIINYHSLE